MEKKSMKTRLRSLCLTISALGICGTSFAQQAAVPPTPTPTPPPSTSIQIVNATSTPSVALEVNGRSDYPDFPQGEFTSDAPTEGLNYRYKVTNKSDGVSLTPPPVTFKNMENQTLLMIGDFSKEAQEGKMPQPKQQTAIEQTSKTPPPNLLLRVYSHQDGLKKKSVKIRIINGMPRKILNLVSPKKIALSSGDETELEGEPTVQMYFFQVDSGQNIPVLMRQDSNPMNANIVFYLKNNEPAFMRFFESTGRPPVE